MHFGNFSYHLKRVIVSRCSKVKGRRPFLIHQVRELSTQCNDIFEGKWGRADLRVFCRYSLEFILKWTAFKWNIWWSHNIRCHFTNVYCSHPSNIFTWPASNRQRQVLIIDNTNTTNLFLILTTYKLDLTNMTVAWTTYKLNLNNITMVGKHTNWTWRT